MSNAATTAYPLSWPAGRPRTPSYKRTRPKFTAGNLSAARDGLLAELRRLGAARVILSSNVELRQDGLPYSGRRQPDDPGVAVYFTRRGRSLALCCDLWSKVEENMDALARWVEAQRGQERWVGSDFTDAVFTGFAALPPSSSAKPWWEMLGVSPRASRDEVGSAYRRLSLVAHPDRGGSHDQMAALNAAKDAGLAAQPGACHHVVG